VPPPCNVSSVAEVSAHPFTLVEGDLDATGVTAAAALSARAYTNDPFFAYIFTNPRRRERSVALTHQSVFELRAPRRCVVHARDENGAVIGVAVWLRPGGFPLPPLSQLRQIPLGLQALRGHRQTFRRGKSFQQHIVKLHPRTPHWYLWSLTVAPEWQHRGVGTALVRDGLHRADSEQVGVHLETQNPDNLHFYERFGFAHSHTIQPTPDSASIYGMWRPAVTQ